MEIVIDIDNIPIILNLDKNIIFFGKNSNYSFGISDLNIFAFEVKYSIN